MGGGGAQKIDEQTETNTKIERKRNERDREREVQRSGETDRWTGRHK